MKMSRIEELFHQSLEVPPSGREAWIERHCAEDPHLASEIRTLLEHAEQENALDGSAVVRQDAGPDPLLAVLVNRG